AVVVRIGARAGLADLTHAGRATHEALVAEVPAAELILGILPGDLDPADRRRIQGGDRRVGDVAGTGGVVDLEALVARSTGGLAATLAAVLLAALTVRGLGSDGVGIRLAQGVSGVVAGLAAA